MRNLCVRGFVVSSLAVLLVFCWLVPFSAPVAAQSTFGSISGSVTDASGAAMPDATATLTNSATETKQTVTTGPDGLYSFVNLPPGSYVLDVEKQGFKHFKRDPVVVQVQQAVRIDVPMEVGAVTQTVEITAETPLLTPTTTSLGQVVDERKTNEIPLNGRNVFTLITLSPAAVANGNGSGTSAGNSPVGPNPFSWGNYQVGGSFGNQSAEYLDGQPVNIGYINLPVLLPDQDSISEFKVQYNNLGPEWGKFSGGVVNLSTKGGTNQYHGAVVRIFPQQGSQFKAVFPGDKSSLRAEPVRRHSWRPNYQGQDVLFLRVGRLPSAGILSIYYDSAHRGRAVRHIPSGNVIQFSIR